MKLYYSKGACSLAVRITLHELNLSCVYEAVDLKTKKTETDQDYLKINPKGAVPALLLDNDEVLTENSAIHQYLADKNHATELLPDVRDLKRYRVIEWLNFVSTDLHKGFGPLFNSDVPEKDKKEIFIPIIKKKLKFVDDHLGGNKYLMGDQFTLPDGYLFVILRWLPHFKMEISDWSNLTHYFNELKKRKSIADALHEEGLKVD